MLHTEIIRIKSNYLFHTGKKYMDQYNFMKLLTIILNI